METSRFLREESRTSKKYLGDPWAQMLALTDVSIEARLPKVP